MPTYTVNYAFQVAGAEDKPEKERWGFGRVPITTEVEPTSDDHFMEIARTIGKKNGYEVVRVQHITETVPEDEADAIIGEESDVIEGTIVDDSK